MHPCFRMHTCPDMCTCIHRVWVVKCSCAGSKKRKRVNRNEGIGTEQKEISSSINFLLGKIFNGAGIKEKKRKKKRKEWKIGLASVGVFENANIDARVSMLQDTGKG